MMRVFTPATSLTQAKTQPNGLLPQFGHAQAIAPAIIRQGERLNLWVSRLSEKNGLQFLFPGTTITSPLFRLNVKETLPVGLAGLLLLYLQGQQFNPNRVRRTPDRQRALKLAGEAALSTGLIATTQYVYPALGLAAWAYAAGKEPTAIDKLNRGIGIVLSMAALATGSYLGMGYNLHQTRQDIASILPLLQYPHLNTWNQDLQPLWNQAAPEHVSPEHWATMQTEARDGWRQFLHRAQVSLDDADSIRPELGKRAPRRPAARQLLKTFDIDFQTAQQVSKKYRIRHQVIGAFERLHSSLVPLERLHAEVPDTAFPKELKTLLRKLSTVNQPYIRLARFLTPVAFGILLNQLVAWPIRAITQGITQWVVPNFMQRTPLRVPEQLAWMNWNEAPLPTATAAPLTGSVRGTTNAALQQPAPDLWSTHFIPYNQRTP